VTDRLRRPSAADAYRFAVLALRPPASPCRILGVERPGSAKRKRPSVASGRAGSRRTRQRLAAPCRMP
jgi:hypothetical protein